MTRAQTSARGALGPRTDRHHVGHDGRQVLQPVHVPVVGLNPKP